MRKRIKYVLLLALTLSPLLTTIGCKFNYQNKITEGNDAVLADYVNTTSRISKMMILSQQEQWRPTQVINDILSLKEGDSTTRDVIYPYFGQLLPKNWNPNYKDFFSSNQLANEVIEPSKIYTQPDNGYLEENRMLSLIKTIISTANTLDANTINTALGSDIVVGPIKKYITTENVNKWWKFYQDNNFSNTFTKLNADIALHQQWITSATSYSTVLQWANQRIKQVLVDVGCQGLSESYCSEPLDDSYKGLMQQFIKLTLTVSPIGIKVDINEEIKNNFIKGLQKPENIGQLIIPVVALLSYFISIFDQLNITDADVTWKNDDAVINSGIPAMISTQLNKPYVGIDGTGITKLKPMIDSLLKFNEDGGLGLRKILIILAKTPPLFDLFSWFEFATANINSLANNWFPLLGLVTGGDSRVFTYIFNLVKPRLENNSIITIIRRFLSYIPSSFNNINANNVINQLGIIINQLNTNILTSTNISDILSAITNDTIVGEIYRIIGYNLNDLQIVPNGPIDILLQVLANNDIGKFLTLISSDDNGILKRIIDDNLAYINANYFNLYSDTSNWVTSNLKMVYNSTEDSLEVFYNIQFKKQEDVTKYAVAWKTLNYKKESGQSFKITKFDKL